MGPGKITDFDLSMAIDYVHGHKLKPQNIFGHVTPIAPLAHLT